jgi:hypothetical protein
MTTRPPSQRAALALLLLAAGCGGGRVPGPADPAPADVAPPLEGPSGKDLPRDPDPRFVRTVWHDGDAERELWLDPTLLVDHRPAQAPSEEAAELLAGARERSDSGSSARLLELPATSIGSDRVAAALRGARRYSPAFRAAPSDRAALWSLPGGVIVTFGPEWEPEEARAWLAARGLTVERRLELGQPAFVVASDPGLPALELAEELRTLPEVRSAQPDWWRPAERS